MWLVTTSCVDTLTGSMVRRGLSSLWGGGERQGGREGEGEREEREQVTGHLHTPS